MSDLSQTSLGDDPLLATKVHLPRVGDAFVPRPHLVSRLNEGLARRLSLISAPPGYGKTTLLSEWIPHSPRCVTWVTLDEGDGDPVRFCRYVIAAIQKLKSSLGESALSQLRTQQRPQPPLGESALTTLLNDITSFPDDFALVLDDYHTIDAEPVHAALTFLLDHLPRNMHLVIATRTDPPLPLARLRMRGELNELRAADLRFSPAEAAAFLNDVMGLNLPPEDVAALETRTEGWIAGLQLAALTMQGRDDVRGFVQSFAGSHRHIVDYLAEEVFHQQPDDIQQFLMQTSILHRLTGSLCDAVTGRSDSQAILGQLEAQNLFTVPLDEERRWYRYHALFAEVLRHRLWQTQLELVPELRRRAAAWYTERGLEAEAHRYIPDEQRGPQAEGTAGTPALAGPLTERELEVMRLIAAGASNQEIADELVIALNTVKRHVNNVFHKLDVSHRTQAVARARELGLI